MANAVARSPTLPAHPMLLEMPQCFAQTRPPFDRLASVREWQAVTKQTSGALHRIMNVETLECGLMYDHAGEK